MGRHIHDGIKIRIAQPKLQGPGPFTITADRSGALVTAEEAGTLWVWAYPELLDWPHPVAWVAPRVSSDGVGDLIGVDARGDVLAVETKRSTRTSRLSDPFKDFVPAQADRSAAPPVDQLRRAWRGQLEQERSWVAGGCQIDERTLAPGVVPYSYHRASIARWPELYRTAIKPIVLSEAYESQVEAHLTARQKAVEPSIHYIGLFTTCHDRQPGLSKSGRISYRALVNRVGAAAVHMRGVRAMSSGSSVVVQQVHPEAMAKNV